MPQTEQRFVTSGPLRLWTERAGDPDHPPVLMIMGAAAQGISCPDALVARLVTRGVQVILLPGQPEEVADLIRL